MPMNRTRVNVWKTFAFSALLAGAATTWAAPSAEQVVEASPIDDIISQYPQMMNQGIRQGLSQGTQLQPFLVNSIGSVVSSAFSGAGIEQKLIQDIGEKLNDQQLEEVLEWYQTPLAERISRAEVNASSPSAWKEVQARAGELGKSYQGSEFAGLFDRYDDAARATESSVDTAIAVQLSMATAMNALRGSNAVPAEQLREQIESQRTMLRGQVGQQVYTAYLYTYNEFEPDELREYIEFLESDAGAAFTRVSTESIQTSLMDPVDMISQKLSQLLGTSGAQK